MSLSCMGGWCALRERCARYQAADRSEPVERLCEPGTSDCYEPLRPSFVPRDAEIRVVRWPSLDPESTDA